VSQTTCTTDEGMAQIWLKRQEERDSHIEVSQQIQFSEICD
jgi:hypothetical protein